MIIMDLEEIKVYNPKEDGFDYDVFKKTYNFLSKRYGIGVANNFQELINNKVLDSRVEGKETLREYLWGLDEKGLDGYFEDNEEEIEGVIIMDGKVRAKYKSLNEIPNEKDLETLAKAFDSMTFVYSAPPLIESP